MKCGAESNVLSRVLQIVGQSKFPRHRSEVREHQCDHSAEHWPRPGESYHCRGGPLPQRAFILASVPPQNQQPKGPYQCSDNRNGTAARIGDTLAVLGLYEDPTTYGTLLAKWLERDIGRRVAYRTSAVSPAAVRSFGCRISAGTGSLAMPAAGEGRSCSSISTT
jgi:hypothetical protein